MTYATCLVCTWTGTTNAAAERHTRDTQHGTNVSDQPMPERPFCKCGHRDKCHAYRSERPRGKCLVHGCECAGFSLQVRGLGEKSDAGNGRMKRPPGGALTPSIPGASPTNKESTDG